MSDTNLFNPPFSIEDIPMWNVETQKPIYPFREGGVADGKIITPVNTSLNEVLDALLKMEKDNG